MAGSLAENDRRGYFHFNYGHRERIIAQMPLENKKCPKLHIAHTRLGINGLHWLE